MLTSFARALTGDKKLNIRSGQPRTDGKVIYLMPPIILGDSPLHNRDLCDVRGPDGFQSCPACSAHELAMAVLYHECSHIAFDSFTDISEKDKLAALTASIEEHGGKRAEMIFKHLDGIAERTGQRWTYMGLAGAISPWMPLLYNALEDARVNRAMASVRPGIKKMFEALNKSATNGTFTGNEDDWSERNPDIQIILGMYMEASDYDVSDLLLGSVVEHLHDPILRDLYMKASESATALDTYELAFPVLERLRELGYCVRQDDPDEPDSGDEKEESDSGTENQQDSESGESGSSSGSSNSGEEGKSSPPSEGGSASSEDDSDSESSDAGSSEHEPDDSEDGVEDKDQSGSDSTDGSDESSTDEPDDADSGAGADDVESPDDDPDGAADGSGEDDPSDATGEDSRPVSDEAEDSSLESASHEPGDPDEARLVLKIVSGHEVDDPSDENEQTAVDRDAVLEQAPAVEGQVAPSGFQASGEDDAVNKAVAQQEFDAPSVNIGGVRVFRHKTSGDEAYAWTDRRRRRSGWDYDEVIEPAESILGRALLQMRVTFMDNRRSTKARNLKSGRIDARVLGRRAGLGDERLFNKKSIPGKKDYFVTLGLDVSGSTTGDKCQWIKSAAWAQAELLERAGVDFAIYAHSGSYSAVDSTVMLDIFCVKEAEEPWSTEVKQRLKDLTSGQANLDGHTMEFYRKVLDQSRATDKVMLYYTDGAMPMENYTEEREILERELVLCKRKGYTVLGVGIQNNDPIKYGMDTVRLDSLEDVGAVVKHLQRYLVRR